MGKIDVEQLAEEAVVLRADHKPDKSQNSVFLL